MDIYDRWGENIFTSTEFKKGWDGFVNGGSKAAPQGVYTYKILVADLLGNQYAKIGHVTVIKQE
jgi:gliding motility-associated-like protein